MKKIVLFLLLSALTIPGTLIAQVRHTLYGEILATDGIPIEGAAVTVKGNSSLWAESDSKGAFRLKLQGGSCTIVVSLVGYQTLEKEIVLEGDSRIKITLAEQAENLEEVMVVGKSNAQLLRESAMAVSALNIRPIINSAHNLNTIVNKTTGVKVRESGGVGSDFELSINGMSGNSVRYFIDGVPLSSKGSGVNLANLPVNIIERIEIYKGVVPAHLGADALGGAINIITKEERRNYLDFSYGYGSFNTHKSDFNAQYVSKNGLIFKPVIGVNFSENNYKVRDVEV